EMQGGFAAALFRKRNYLSVIHFDPIHNLVDVRTSHESENCRQTVRGPPRTKCNTSEINATTSRMWISAPVTCRTPQPRIHAKSRMTNKIVKILMIWPPSGIFGLLAPGDVRYDGPWK